MTQKALDCILPMLFYLNPMLFYLNIYMILFNYDNIQLWIIRIGEQL